MFERNDDSATEPFAERLEAFHDSLVDGSAVQPSPPMTASDEFARMARCLAALEEMRQFRERDSLTGDRSNAIAGCADDVFDELEPFDPDDGRTRRIGRFTIQRRLGSGGQGLVFLAFDPLLDRQVALKLPQPHIALSLRLRQRFLDEARFAARLRHPHLVTVYEVGEIGPLCYIAAEFCDGPNLGTWLAAQPRPLDAFPACQLLLKLAAAVTAMHQAQVLHRDLKPSNVLLQQAPGSGTSSLDLSGFTPKITDFGLARLFDSKDPRTRTGAMIGTPAYMSPEQARGDTAQIGPASDVFSLGVLLYELLACIAPFSGSSDADTVRRILDNDLVPLRQKRGQVPRDLEAICHKCLEPRPADRYATAADLHDDLNRFLRGEPTHARPLTAAQQIARWAYRRPALAALAAVSCTALIVIAAGLGWFTLQLRGAVAQADRNAADARASREVAQREEARANTHLYAAQMRLASLALEQGDHQRAKQLLAPYAAGAPLAGLRGFEWSWLRQQSARMANRRPTSTTTQLLHPDEVYAVDFSPDDQTLATGCKDGVIRFYDVARREQTYQWQAHQSCVNSLSYSPQGGYLASGGCDRALRFWKLERGQPPRMLHEINDFATPLRDVKFSPDGKQVAGVCYDGVAQLWNVETGQRDRALDTSDPHVRRVTWSPDGRSILALRTSSEGPIFSRLFNLEAGTAKLLEATGVEASFAPDGSFVSILSLGNIGHFALENGIETNVAAELSHHAKGLEWSADGRWLATIFNDSTALVFDRANGGRQVLLAIDGLSQAEELSLSRDGSLLATASRDKRVCLTDLRPHREPPLRSIPLAPFSSRVIQGGTAVDAEQRNLLVASSTGLGRLSLGEETLWQPITLPADAAFTLPSTTGANVVVVAPDGVQLIDVASGTARRVPAELARDAVRAYYFDDRQTLVLVSGQRRIRVLDDRTWQIRYEAAEQFQWPPESLYVYLSPDGKWLAHIDNWSQLTCVNLQTGESHVRHERDLGDVAFFHQSDRMVCVLRDVIAVYGLPELKLEQTLRFGDRPRAIALSPDDRTLAIASSRGLTLNHLASSQELLMVPIRGMVGHFARFRPDGKALTVTGFRDGNFNVYQWRID